MEPPAWQCEGTLSPTVAVALHAGHELRDEVAALMAIDEQHRLMEEDPHTDTWASLAGSRVKVFRSRFEVDLNRPREAAVYLEPDQAWGMAVWKRPPPAEIVDRSRCLHDAFYRMLEDLLERTERTFGRFVVYDLHAYNHRRGGRAAPAADPAENPDVNVGTGSMDRDRWAPVVERFMGDLRAAEVAGRALDVRENVRFRGGYLCQWVHQRFPTAGCAVAIEVKKFFMDEHIGQVDAALLGSVGEALAATAAVVVEALGRS
ncbi:MAG: N-formylglutamate amidohydrolase [Actinomycetota bacterium]